MQYHYLFPWAMLFWMCPSCEATTMSAQVPVFLCLPTITVAPQYFQLVLDSQLSSFGKFLMSINRLHNNIPSSLTCLLYRFTLLQWLLLITAGIYVTTSLGCALCCLQYSCSDVLLYCTSVLCTDGYIGLSNITCPWWSIWSDQWR